ncbi:MAG: hypothetical protein MJ249_02585 [Kiritimatiellae bacterium]|nr:hypothetical protein [Kiritimatiellia bacterium]
MASEEHKKILYLHGFGSSGSSGTVDLLRHEYWEKRKTDKVIVLAPDIPVDPAEALPKLKALAEKEQPALIVGTSMGGMYAQQLRGFERICVNPYFEMSKLYSIVSVGRHKWFNPRQDGALTFQITKDIIAHFAEMEAHQFDGLDEVDQIFCHGLFGTEDEISALARPTFEHYYPGMSQTFEGGHRMNDDIAHGVLFPFINSLGCI